MPKYPAPMTIDEALRASRYLPVPKRICVKPEGKYTKIVSAEF